MIIYISKIKKDLRKSKSEKFKSFKEKSKNFSLINIKKIDIIPKYN